MPEMIPREPFHPEISTELSELLEGESLVLFGITGPDASDVAHYESEYRSWIAGGYHGSMRYLARNESMKYRPQEVMHGCRSVIVAGMNYFQEADRTAGKTAPQTGRVARYAWGRDYHNALGKRLKRVVRALRERHPGEQFRAFVDASPLSERHLAALAGIAYVVRNTLAISSAYGSWFFLGEILTTVDYPSATVPDGVHGACPSGCFRCGEACPTGALFAPHRIDARRCISYLTIEYRGSIHEELRPLMDDWIFGCDLCQEVCPLNIRARQTTIQDFLNHRAGPRLRLGDILDIPDDASYRERFAGTPLLRPGREALIRNACIASANTQAHDLLPRLKRLAHSESRLIREHARWAVHRMEA